MRVGLIMVWQNFANRLPDEEAYRRDLSLAADAERLGSGLKQLDLVSAS